MHRLEHPGELEILPSLTSGFLNSMKEHHISLRLVAGSWASLSEDAALAARFDVVLTSETIYRSSSLPSLLDLLKKASSRPDDGVTLSDTKSSSQGLEGRASALCLVAAKILYFGVGGGVMEFIQTTTQRGGVVRTIHENDAGVGRKVLQVSWM